jgi:hypothetical protein
MTKSIWFALCASATLLLCAGPSAAKGNPRMAECNKESAGKTGEARKKFMSECLAQKPEAKKLTPQQEKMKECNQRAGAMKGQARKAFMSECLKK